MSFHALQKTRAPCKAKICLYRGIHIQNIDENIRANVYSFFGDNV